MKMSATPQKRAGSVSADGRYSAVVRRRNRSRRGGSFLLASNHLFPAVDLRSGHYSSLRTPRPITPRRKKRAFLRFMSRGAPRSPHSCIESRFRCSFPLRPRSHSVPALLLSRYWFSRVAFLCLPPSAGLYK